MTSRRLPRALALVGAAALASCIPTPPQGPARAPNTRVPDSFGGAAEADN
jgi:hypothetical protein